MTERCADLDEFFDGELPADQADAFRDHLPACARCQRVLHGRMQESVAARVPAVHAAAAPSTLARSEDPEHGLPPTAAPAAAHTRARDQPAGRRGLRRVLMYAAPVLAAAAAVPLWLGHGSEPEFELAVAVQRAPAANRSDRGADAPRTITVHPGDVVRPTVRGARNQAIRIYAGEGRLIAECPGDARCREDRGELTLELALTDHGKYAIVGLGSSGPLPPASATLDLARVAARRAGIRIELQYADVE